MRGILVVLTLLLAVSLSFAVLMQSGDNRISFSAYTSIQKCSETGVSSVYTCKGNVVRVNWTDSSKGLTFYSPDGRVQNCPPLPPSQIGAFCMQMMMPNYCEEQVVCSTVSQPAQPIVNQTQQPAANQTQQPAPQVIPQAPKPTQNQTAVIPSNNNTTSSTESNKPVANVTVGSPATTPSANANSTFSLDNLMWIIIALGIIALAILFALFKRSISE